MLLTYVVYVATHNTHYFDLVGLLAIKLLFAVIP